MKMQRQMIFFTFFCTATTFVKSSSDNQFCEGNGNFFDGHQGNMDENYRVLKKTFTGCKYVYGDLTISSIHSTKKKYNFSFFESIAEVSGSVNIHNVSVALINLKNLRVIRGEGLRQESDGRGIALRIWENYRKKGDEVIDLSGLRSVMNGDISLNYNYKNCYVHFKVDLYELLDNLDVQQVSFTSLRTQKIPTSQTLNCDANVPCDSSCPRWSSRQPLGIIKSSSAYCWGPGPHLCQFSNKCQAVHQNGGTPVCSGINPRCFNGTQCCHSECAGGCFGSGPDKCFACRAFKDDKKCVSACPKRIGYKKSLYQNEPNPDFMLTYGPFCVKKCPSGYFLEEDACVKFCSKGYKKNDNTKECNRCGAEDCKGTCRPNFDQKNSLTRLDLGFLKDCEYIYPAGKRLIINNQTFFSPEFSISRQQLFDIFKNVIEIDSTLQINVPNDFIDFSFLKNLKVLRGSLIFFNDSANKNLQALNFKYLGFQRLKQIGNIHMGISGMCREWFPTEAALQEMSLDGSSPSKLLTIQATFGSKEKCANASCHSACDPFRGCWGPTAAMCVSCRYYLAGDLCVHHCNESNYYYDEKHLFQNKSCSLCNSECAGTCRGPSDSQCISCRNYKMGKSCVASCPHTHYSDNKTKQCLECSSVCDKEYKSLVPGGRSCSGPNRFLGQTGCTACKLVRVYNKSSVIGCIEKICQEGFYEKKLSPHEEQLIKSRSPTISFTSLKKIQNCSPCDPNCITCEFQSTFCSKCRYASQPANRYMCLKECPKGTFQHANSTDCLPCANGCLTCSGNGQEHCQECEDVHIYHNLLNISAGFNCSKKCPSWASVVNFNTILKRFCATHQINFFDKAASLHQEEQRKKNTVILSVSIPIIIIIFLGFMISCYWMRQKARAKRDETKYLNSVDNREEYVPLNPTSAPPNMAKLLIIKESELRRFDKPIGSGAFGTVYQGIWIPSDANARISVAIKVLTESSLNDELLDEAKVMASIQHPCCVRLLCVCMTSQLQLVSQLMPLGSLLDYLSQHKSKIGSKHMLLWASQIASGMNHLEHHGIIHRDLAARNVLVQSPLQVKITDFGLAKVLDVYESDFLATSGKLPVKWLALESLQHKIFNFKTDVWAFGVTLWELFTFGQRPYENIRVRDLCDFLEKGERLPQPNICTLDVYMIMIKCWMLDADNRPSFRELEIELQKMASDPGRFLYIPGDQFARLPSVDVYDPDVVFPREIVDNPDYGCTLPLVTADEYLTPTPNNTTTDIFDNSVVKPLRGYTGVRGCASPAAAAAACDENILEVVPQHHSFLQRCAQEKLRYGSQVMMEKDHGRYTSDPCSAELGLPSPLLPPLCGSTSDKQLNCLIEEEDYLSPKFAQIAAAAVSVRDTSLQDDTTLPKEQICVHDYTPMLNLDNPEYFAAENSPLASTNYFNDATSSCSKDKNTLRITHV